MLDRQFIKRSRGSVSTSQYESATRPSDSARLCASRPCPLPQLNSALDADDCLRDITFELESADVAPASYVTVAACYLKGPAAQWWDNHMHSLLVGTTITWPKFQAVFRGTMSSHHG